VPTYQYVCTECATDLEVVQSFQDAPLIECPTCGGRLRKKFGAVGVVFKGSGFYRNDSRKGPVPADGEQKADKPEKVDASASSGSGSNGSGSNGSGSSDSGSSGSSGSSGASSGGSSTSSGSSSGAGSKGSDAKGSGSKGSDSKGAGSKGTGSKGTANSPSAA